MPPAQPQPENDRLVEYGKRLFARFSLDNYVSCVPVDEVEEQRMDELNRILRTAFGRTVLPDFPPEDVEEPRVLDCGFGKGAWIEDLLSTHDECEVTGIDIFLGQGTEEELDSDASEQDNDDEVQEFFRVRWNLNAPFREDRSSSRLRRDYFDLINSRLLAEGINQNRWVSYIGELKQLLRRGGWLQILEMDLCIQSYNGLLPDDSCIRRWWSLHQEAMIRLNKNPRVGRGLQKLLEDQGFDRIGTKFVDLAIGHWNPDMVALGGDNRANIWETIKAMSLFHLQCRPGGAAALVTKEQYRLLLEGIYQELQESDQYKLYYKVYVAWGRRPRQRRP